MQLFQPTETDIDLHPTKDPEVIRLRDALAATRRAAEPAAAAWKAYCAEHCDDPISVPFSRQKQRLYDKFSDTAWDLDDAEAALQPVLEQATRRAEAAWNDRIRAEVIIDAPIVPAVVAMLKKYEALVAEANAAGVSKVFSVSTVFCMGASDLDTQWHNTLHALGVE
jgi:hypothetical protein